MGTLREESLVRIYIDNELRPIAQDFIRVNERIRDLEVTSDGVVVATTDSGKILEITPVK
jgi:glucose/arabinose dehydrogenase